MPDEVTPDLLQRASDVQQQFGPILQPPERFSEPSESDKTHPLYKHADQVQWDTRLYSQPGQPAWSYQSTYAGDAGSRRKAKELAAEYGKALREKTPELGQDHISDLQSGYEDHAFQNTRTWQLHNMVLQAAQKPVGMTALESAARGMKNVGVLGWSPGKALENMRNRDVKEKFDAEAASDQHYQKVADQLGASKVYDRMNVGQKAMAKSGGFMAGLLEFYTGSKILKGAGIVGAAPQGAGLTARMWQGAKLGGALTAAEAPGILGTQAGARAFPGGIEQDPLTGYAIMPKGESLGPAFLKTMRDRAIANITMTAMSPGGADAVSFLGKVVQHGWKGAAPIAISAGLHETSAAMDHGYKGTYLSQWRNGTDEDRSRILSEIGSDAILFGGAHGFMSALDKAQTKATELRRQGVPEPGIGAELQAMLKEDISRAMSTGEPNAAAESSTGAESLPSAQAAAAPSGVGPQAAAPEPGATPSAAPGGNAPQPIRGEAGSARGPAPAAPPSPAVGAAAQPEPAAPAVPVNNPRLKTGDVIHDPAAQGLSVNPASIGRDLPSIPPKKNHRVDLSEYTKRLYHETSMENASLFYPNSTSSSQRGDIWLSNTPDLATGQGDNKGVLLEFDSKGISGHINKSKPAWDMSWQADAAEFLDQGGKDYDYAPYRSNLRAITIKPNTQGSKGRVFRTQQDIADLQKHGWTQTKNSDGSVTYRHPSELNSSPAAQGLPERAEPIAPLTDVWPLMPGKPEQGVPKGIPQRTPDSGIRPEGWKLHLASDKPEEVSKVLKQLGFAHKVGRSGQEGKDLTVYIGSHDNATLAAQQIRKEAGHLLREPHGDTLDDDIAFGSKVMGRFDATSQADFHQYGEKGIPWLNADMDPFNRRPGANDRADAELRKRYGEFYTGTNLKLGVPAGGVRVPKELSILEQRLTEQGMASPSKVTRFSKQPDAEQATEPMTAGTDVRGPDPTQPLQPVESRPEPASTPAVEAPLEAKPPLPIGGARKGKRAEIEQRMAEARTAKEAELRQGKPTTAAPDLSQDQASFEGTLLRQGMDPDSPAYERAVRGWQEQKGAGQYNPGAHELPAGSVPRARQLGMAYGHGEGVLGGMGAAVPGAPTPPPGTAARGTAAPVVPERGQFIPPQKPLHQQAADFFKSMAQQSYPALTRIAPGSAEKLVQASNAKGAAEHAWNYFSNILKVGDKRVAQMTPEERRLIGTAWLETRMRHYREYLNANGLDSSEVGTFVGQSDSPLGNEADFQEAYRGLWSFWEGIKQEWTPAVEKNFRGIMGLDPNDAIDSPSQIPGLPLNAIPISDPADIQPGVVGTSKQSLANLRIRKPSFTKQAELNAPAYDTDVGHMMQKTLETGTGAARRAEFVRQATADNVIQIVSKGERADPGYKELMLKPAPGLPELPPGSRYFAHPDAYKDIVQGLGIGDTAAQQLGRSTRGPGVLGRLTQISILTPSELVYHLFVNIPTALFEKGMGIPGYNVKDTVLNAYKAYKNDPAILEKLKNLASISAAFQGREPQGLLGKDYQKYDPTYYVNKFTTGLIDLAQNAMRVQLGEAYDARVRAGKETYSETNKRDFINAAAGNYNNQASNALVQFVKQVGLQPFATAATTYTSQGIKMAAGGAWSGSVATRAAQLAKLLPLFAIGPTYNYLRWGDAFPAGVPAFALQTHEEDENDKVGYIDPLAWPGIRRGLKAIGGSAVIEGAREGKTKGEIFDRAVWDVAVTSLVHPMVGPVGDLASIAYTGKNLYGQQMAPKVSQAQTLQGQVEAAEKGLLPAGSSQMWANIKAGFISQNPVIHGVFPTTRKGEEEGMTGAFWRMGGPFVPKERPAPKIGGTVRKKEVRLPVD